MIDDDILYLDECDCCGCCDDNDSGEEEEDWLAGTDSDLDFADPDDIEAVDDNEEDSDDDDRVYVYTSSDEDMSPAYTTESYIF